MESKLKIYIPDRSFGYFRPFVEHCVITDSMEDADIVLFTGGADVDPNIYGCQRHPTTFCDLNRDVEECGIFEQAMRSPNIKMCIGICRGSQFLCAMSGGLLVQDVTNHAIYGTHPIINKDGDKFEITSTHHQMQYPYNLNPKEYEILFWADPNRSRHYEGDHINWKPEYVEPEIVYYRNTKSLAIQGHPEMLNYGHPTIEMINNLIKKYI